MKDVYMKDVAAMEWNAYRAWPEVADPDGPDATPDSDSEAGDIYDVDDWE